MNEIQEVFYRHQKGMGQRAIARSLGMSRNTVKRLLNEGVKLGLQGANSVEELEKIAFRVKALRQSPYRGKGSMQESLQKEHEQIVAWKDSPHMTVTQMVRLFGNLGKKVSETSLRRYLKTHFPKEVKTSIHLETEPGDQGQVDFAYVGMLKDMKGDLRKAYAFIMVLSYSRYRYVRFVFNQDIETWIESHKRAFEFFGGVPRTILLDNLKAGVTRPDFYDPVKNKTYGEMERHYGFIADPTKVRTPEHKGKVERSVTIMRQQVLAGRDFKDIEEANARALEWCQKEISERVTRTTGETPGARYEREKEYLNPLPLEEYECTKWQKARVHKDQHVVYRGSFYSVPYLYVGKEVWLRIGARLLEVYLEEKRIKVHPLCGQKGQWITDTKDYPERSLSFIEKDRGYCLEEAKKIGSSTGQFFEEILHKPSLTQQRKAQAILRLGAQYGAGRLEASCKRALRFDNLEYKSLKRILVQGLDETDKETEERIQEQQEALKEGSYLRSPREFTGLCEGGVI